MAIDEQRDQYILFALGWHGEEYVHKWIFHLQIKDQLIWIHEDTTDVGIARIIFSHSLAIVGKRHLEISAKGQGL